MQYPIDVERELDKAEERLCNTRISGEKWQYFRELIEEINRAFSAGEKGASGYPLDIGINLSADSERFGGFGVVERHLVASWMEMANDAYRKGGATICHRIPETQAAGAFEFVNPKSGLTVKTVKDLRDLEYYLAKFVRDGKPFGFKVPGVERIATVCVRSVTV